MKTREHKRIVGRVMPYDRDKMKAALAQFGIEMSDEPIGPYQPWEERILGAVNGLLANHLTSEKEAILQTLGQYKVFCYWLENKLPQLIADNPGASGRLLMAMAAQSYTLEMMLWAQRRNQEAQDNGPLGGKERPAW